MSAAGRGRRRVAPMTAEALVGLPTRALLARLRALRALHDSLAASDWSDEEAALATEAGGIAFKDSADWKQAMAEVKAVLATRGHVLRGGKEARRRVQAEKQQR
ncbi:hypothetical protein [Xinfangfangia pollutisoli]|uniref:hypothetical protein n=1 Tax=Xinfangfangia pollutisoli TaxID=2865960 RepID=UPI001CD50645|nr:hypothetical protein [Xinfangfangia pollutisoli]